MSENKLTKKLFMTILAIAITNACLIFVMFNSFTKAQEVKVNEKIVKANGLIMMSNEEIMKNNVMRLDALELSNKAFNDNIKSMNKTLELLRKQVEELKKPKIVSQITKTSPSRGGYVSYSPENVGFKKKISTVVTAYTLDGCGKSPGDKGYGITASGKKAKANWTVAVDTSVIPMGSKIYIPYFKGYPNKGIFYAEDTGVKGLFGVDVFVHSNTTARKIGRSVKEVYILK